MKETIRPIQKADQLIKQFSPRCAGNSQTLLNRRLAIQCALIVVDEIWEALHLEHAVDTTHGFWSNVRFELENMLDE